jgi:hypothetical protein
VYDFAFANRLHRLPQSIKARNIRRKCIAGHPNDDEPKRELMQVILMFEFAVDGHEDIKPTLGEAQERVILTASPTGFGHGRNWMSRKCRTHTGVNTFV